MPIQSRLPIVTLLVLGLSAGAASAQTPPSSDARYEMSPVEGGFLRLDKQTGAVAMCARRGEEWTCESVDDRTAATNAPRDAVEAENHELKSRVKALEEALKNIEESPGVGNGPPVPKSQLPTEEEVDQAFDYVERIFKKFRDRIRRLDEPLPSPPAPPPAPDEESTTPPKQL